MATTLLRQVNFRHRALRALAVGAWLRLRTELPQLTQERFCETLALPTRTLRSWLQHHPSTAEALPDRKQPPARFGPRKRSANPRKPRRPRFSFDLVVPDTQLGADTTDLSVLGVSLKLVAAQDIGGRDENLFDQVVIDDHEDAEHVVNVLVAAIAGQQAIQIITDQGTPYMAKATRDALDQLGAEHAPHIRSAKPRSSGGSVFSKPLRRHCSRYRIALPALSHLCATSNSPSTRSRDTSRQSFETKWTPIVLPSLVVTDSNSSAIPQTHKQRRTPACAVHAWLIR